MPNKKDPKKLMEGFHRLTREERLARVREISNLTEEEVMILSGDRALPFGVAEHLIENVEKAL